MPDQPIPLSDDDLDAVSGGVGAPSKDASAALQDLMQTPGADIYAIMAQFQQLAQEQRHAAREQRATDMQAQVDNLEGAADAIRQAAAERMAAAIHQGTFAIASGVAGIGGGIGAGGKFDALETDAKRAELDAQEAVQKQGVQNANDLMEQMQSIIKDTRDKLNSIEESRIETNRGIARNI